MKSHLQQITAVLVGVAFVTAAATSRLIAADGNDAIKTFMKECHKAPKGVDPTCKKAADGKASPEELKKLVAGYKVMAAAKPPQGDEKSWKDKTSKLLAAAEALEKGEAGAAARYKEAVNCKACHSAHKPD